MYQYQKRIGEKTMMSGWWRFSSWIMRLPNVCIYIYIRIDGPPQQPLVMVL